jgi:predicted nucleotidyltransferase
MAIERIGSTSSPPAPRPRLTPAQQQAMESIVAALPSLLRQAYGDDLLAVVLFGSVARGTPHACSDTDWLVVLRQRSAEPRKDHRGCEEARRALTPELAAAAETGLLSEPQFHLRSAAEAEQGGALFLDLCHDGHILHDPDGWTARFMARYRERLAAQGSVRVPWGEGWYWRLTPSVRPAEDVWF